MDFISAHIPESWLMTLWLACALLFYTLVRRANWRMLADQGNLNIFLAATVAVLALWQIKTGVKPGLSFHMLGATVLTLMFRPWFALLALTLINLAVTLKSGEYNAFPANMLVMAALPVAINWTLFRFVDSRLPNHFFIYIFVNSFFGAAVAIGMVGLASTAFAALTGAFSLDYLLENYLPFYLLMGWAEAFSTGMIITLLVVYKPEWVATFDDRRYLYNK